MIKGPFAPAERLKIRGLGFSFASQRCLDLFGGYAMRNDIRELPYSALSF